jgi:hypothetical protein
MKRRLAIPLMENRREFPLRREQSVPWRGMGVSLGVDVVALATASPIRAYPGRGYYSNREFIPSFIRSAALIY